LLAVTQRNSNYRIIAVNDASPDPRIANLLEVTAAGGAIDLLRHERNLGFARSVNHALEALTFEDVVLLNADTVLPRGFLQRLQRAADSAPNVGTVTPFSNNGEYTSFPAPFRANPLPATEVVTAIDRAAAAANAGRVVDMPNGTGFCLYVTRRCLDEVGPLSAGYGRGYFEDVDFCLRAEAAGFRNVCATDVFVGHAGARSFGNEKRSLVVRNLSSIEDRFPGYRSVSAAFMAADPLRPAREAIERALLDKLGPATLLVGSEAIDSKLLRARAGILLRTNDKVLIAKAQVQAGRIAVDVRGAAGGLPQSLRLVHSIEEAESELSRGFGSLSIELIEIVSRQSLPRQLLEALRRTNAPIRFFAMPRPSPGKQLKRRVPKPGRLGVVNTDGRATALAELMTLTRALAGPRSPGIVVFGSVFDDLRLMGSGPVFANGPVQPNELAAQARRLGVSHLFFSDRDAVNAAFYRSESEAAGIPSAFFDRAAKRSRRLGGRSLTLPTDASVEAIAHALRRWMGIAARG
jgi:GT2 family glycosyltransferase